MFGPSLGALGMLALATATLGLAASRWRGCPRELRAVPVLVTALLAAMATGMLWQAAMALALALHWSLARLSRGALPAPELGPRGRVPAWPTIVVGGVTPVALVGWLVLMRPDLSDVLRAYLPALPLPVILLGAVGFAVVNATLEELVWRNCFQGALTPALGHGLAIAVQALSFGLAHAHGVPRGPLGVLLAGSWAVMLGILRRHAGGLLAPVLAHVVADATIAAIVLTLATR